MDTINVNEYQNVSWIETLALEEVNMEESGIIRFNDHLNTQQLLEESSLNFVNKLKDRFEFYVSLFNQYRSNKDNSRSIKLFRISPADTFTISPIVPRAFTFSIRMTFILFS